MKRTPMTDVAEIPRVCFVDDVARALRMPIRSMKFQAKYCVGPFAPLPPIDRRIRYSGEVIRWFLSERSYFVEQCRELLEAAKKLRRRRRPWYEFGPPYTLPFVGAPKPKEEATVSVVDLAEILRISPSALRRAVRAAAFPLPPMSNRPLAWTPEQIARFLAPPDIRALQRQARRDEKENDRSAGSKPEQNAKSAS